MGMMVTNVTDVGKCHVNETLKKRIITVILTSTYFDLKKKKQPFCNNEIKYCHHMINMTPSYEDVFDT